MHGSVPYYATLGSPSERAMGVWPTAIVTESAADLPPALAAQEGIEVVPLTIIIDGEAFLDGVDLRPDEFYRRLARASSVPKTSQVTPHQMREAIEAASRRGRTVLCVTLSAELSGTHQAALSAAQAFTHETGVPVEVVDSRTAAVAEGLLAVQAARWGRQYEASEVARRLRAHLARAGLLGTLDTLEYLQRGGRIGRAAAWAGAVLSIKPIIGLRDGTVVPVERVRTRAVALKRLVELVGEQLQHAGRLHMAVAHGHAADDAMRVAEQLERAFRPQELWVAEFTPVMGAHTGPGVIAVGWLEVQEEEPRST